MSLSVKKLQEHYHVYKLDGVYHICDKKTNSGRMNHKFLCVAHKKGGSFYVDGYMPTKNLAKFSAQVEDYVSKLDYDSEYDSPAFVEGTKENWFVCDYLYDLGFENKRGYFCYNPKNVFTGTTTEIKLSFSGLEPLDKEFNNKKVSIFHHVGDYSCVSLEVDRNLKDIKEGIDSFIRPLIISEGIKNLILLDKTGNGNHFDFVLNNLEDMEVRSIFYKEEMKARLKALLADLD